MNILGNFFIRNGSLEKTKYFDYSLINEGESVYEVLRIADGLPVFFDDHFERLKSGTQLTGRKMLRSKELLAHDIISLTASQEVKEANLWIVFNYRESGESSLVYYSKPSYPGSADYMNGVKGIVISAERNNPASKVINNRLRSEINARLAGAGAYEALLADRQGRITEGSRSNIFFIQGTTLITAPDELVLGGITRKHIVEICNENKIKIEFRCVFVLEMADSDGVFLTGTSPVVLPFSQVGEIQFSVDHPLTGFLRSEIMRRMEESRKIFRENAVSSGLLKGKE